MNSKKQFLNWLKRNDPFLYLTAEKVYSNKSQTLSGWDITGFFNSAISTIKNVTPDILKYRQQKKLLDLQINRARNDLPPLDTKQYIPSFPPQQVQVQNPPKVIVRQVEKEAKQVEKKSNNFVLPLTIGAFLMMLK